MEMYRQGDVLLVRVGNLPKGAKDVTPKDRIVLAYGEVTGHAHAVYPEVTEHPVKKWLAKSQGKPEAELKAKLWDAGAERFLQVVEKTALKHEEHAPIDLSPGVYKVVRQREYDPRVDGLARWVDD